MRRAPSAFSARSATSSTRRLKGPANPCSAQIAMTRWPPWPSRALEREPYRRRPARAPARSPPRPSRRRRARPRHASRASRARAAAMPRMAPITDESCRTERMRATTSLSRSVMGSPPRPTRARPRRVSTAPHVAARSLRHDLGHRVRRERVELGRDARPRLDDLGDRRRVEHAVGERRQQRDLSTRRSVAKRGWARSARMRSPRAIVAFTRAVSQAAEAGEHLELEELRIVEPQSGPTPRAAPAPAPCRRPG